MTSSQSIFIGRRKCVGKGEVNSLPRTVYIIYTMKWYIEVLTIGKTKFSTRYHYRLEKMKGSCNANILGGCAAVSAG